MYEFCRNESMNNQQLLDLYTDFLIVCPKQATATGLSEMLTEEVSHDRVTRLLSSGLVNARHLWETVKPMCHEISSDDAVLVIDDSIEAKPYSEVNGLIGWHYDHTFGRSVKGVNFITALYYSSEMSLPVSIEFIIKDQKVYDEAGKMKYKSATTKNEYYRSMVKQSCYNLSFRYVLNDSWFSSAENMRWVHQECGVDFIMAIKENRKVALSKQDKEQGHYTSIKSLKLEGCAVSVYVEQLDFPLLVTKQVFKNGDGSTGTLYLASSDQNLSSDQITTIYQRRWKVEQYHKSIKSNTAFSKSPTHTITTQTSHFIASLIAYIKLERLQIRRSENHFALKNKIWLKATQQAWLSLKQLSTSHAA